MLHLLLTFLNTYQAGITAGDFYEEPLGHDFAYPDW